MEKKRETVSVLFVCLGNICRSPAAEAVLRKKLSGRGVCGGTVFVDSAGIGSWHVGQLPDSRMRRVGERHGYEVNSRARQVGEADFARFDYIFGMDEDNMRDLRSIAHGAVRHGVVSEKGMARLLCAADMMSRHQGFSVIPDPYYGGEQDFELALELIEDACDGILGEIMPRFSCCAGFYRGADSHGFDNKKGTRHDDGCLWM